MSDKECFVICPIGEEESETRKWSNDVFDCIIKPIVEEEFQYKPLRADQIERPGVITNQIIEHLISSDLVIADLSGHNPNVMYELAIRHATEKPCVHIIKNGEKIPFDISNSRTIFFNLDLRGVHKAKIKLRKSLKEIESGQYECENPINIPIKLMQIRKYGDSEQISLAEILTSISSLRSQMNEIQTKLREPSNQRNLRPALAEILNEKLQRIQAELDMLDDELTDCDDPDRKVLLKKKKNALLYQKDALSYKGTENFFKVLLGQ